MRTTLDIDDDVLFAAKERARRENRTAGEIISALARQALNTVPTPGAREPAAVHGFRPFPRRGTVITNELIDQLRDDEP